jgi:subtilase family serine protease
VGSILALKACVDTDDEIQEMDEGDKSKDIQDPDADKSITTNNCSRTERFYIKEDDSFNSATAPDLTIQSLGLQEGTRINQSSIVHPYCVIRNIGLSTPVSGIRTAYYIDGDYRADDGSDAGELAPGRDQLEQVLNNDIRLGVTGTRTLKCCADYKDQVRESNEGNNCASMSFQVVPAGPDFVISGLGFREGTSIKKGSKVHPYCVIKNQGNATPSSGIRTAYYIDGGYRDDDGSDASELAPGREVREQVLNDNIKLGDTGNRTLKCCADYKGQVKELDEGNNCQSLPFTVRK